MLAAKSRATLWLIAQVMLINPAWGFNYSWNNPAGGAFETAANWSKPVFVTGYPDDGTDTAIFSLFAVYTVNFDNDVTNNNAIVNTGTVTWDLMPGVGTSDYNLVATSGAAVLVGSVPGSLFPATLIVSGGYSSVPHFVPGVNTSAPLHIGAAANSVGILELHNTDWDSTSDTIVGLDGTGFLHINEATGSQFSVEMINMNATVGDHAGSNGTVTVDDDWITNGILTIGNSGNGTVTVGPSAKLTSGQDVRIAAASGSQGTLTVHGDWDSFGSVFVGGNVAFAGGVGQLTVADLGHVNIVDDLSVRSTGTVDVIRGSVTVGGAIRMDAGAAMSIGPLPTIIGSASAQIGDSDPLGDAVVVDMTGASSTWTISGDLTLGSAGGAGTRLEVTQGATLNTGNAFVASAPGLKADVSLQSTGGLSRWSSTGSVYLGGDAANSGGAGTLSLGLLGALSASGMVKVWDDFTVDVDDGSLQTPTLEVAGTVDFHEQTLNFDGGTIGELVLVGGTVAAQRIELGSDPFAGFGTLAAEVITQGSITATGNLALGDADSFEGVIVQGVLNVLGHQVTVHKKGFFNIGNAANIAGGTLIVPGGINIPDGAGLAARGTVSGRVVAQAGSVIEATGNLALGDAASVAGFFSDGEMNVNEHTVTLHDANEAVLGSLTTLGMGGVAGTLAAPNGALVEFGKNVEGFGTVDTPNEPTKPLVNNGHITGNSPSERITLPGYVKGIGTFSNVNFTGTLSPGLSTAILSVGNIAFSPTSTLIMELGGTTPGGGYDQIQSSGALAFDGTLQISLTGYSTPAAGQSFNLFDWVSTSGTFDSLQLPLLVGLSWNTSQLYTDGILSLSAAPVLLGDYNQNGTVDAADYTLWRDNLGSGTSLPNDDTAGVGADDYTRWKTHFGETAGSGGSASVDAAIPEPSALVVLVAALVTLAYRRTM